MADEMSVANKEKLVSDLKVVISDTEELLRATAGAAGEKVGDLRERLAIRLRDAKERVIDLEVALVEKSKAAARATDDFVHDEPWKAVGIAAVVGLALGAMEESGQGAGELHRGATSGKRRAAAMKTSARCA